MEPPLLMKKGKLLMLPPRNTQVARLAWYFNPQQTILTYIKLHCTKSIFQDFGDIETSA
jgi:hypothetical protein